jgi:hypothetical protein
LSTRHRSAPTVVAVLLGFLTLPMLMSGTTVALPAIGRRADHRTLPTALTPGLTAARGWTFTDPFTHPVADAS